MSNNASVVVFPSVFARNKIKTLQSNIKKILQIRQLEFGKISRDDSVIVVDANDPVFASSAINLLFGIERVAIAKQIKNDFDGVVSEITKLGSNLLLKGEKYYVKVDGNSSGYIPKDVEIAATSALIEKTAKLGAKPGTEERHDKILYTYLTKSHAYVCIFTDKGLGGIPNNSQQEQILCCVYDELSAVGCLETIKQGYDTKIIICYTKKSELTNLVKILNSLLARVLQPKVELEFFQFKITSSSAKNYLLKLKVIVDVLTTVAFSNKIKKVSLPFSPLILPPSFIDDMIKRVFQKNIIPYTPLSGLDDNIFEGAKEIGLGKYLHHIEKLGKIRFAGLQNSQTKANEIAQKAMKNRKKITVKIGPNNVHDILDSLK